MKLVCTGILKFRVRLQVAVVILFIQLFILFALYISNYSIIISPSRTGGPKFSVANDQEALEFAKDKEAHQPDDHDEQNEEEHHEPVKEEEKEQEEHKEHEHDEKNGHEESVNKVAKGWFFE